MWTSDLVPAAPYLLFLALALDALVGEAPWRWLRLPHPVAAIGRAIAVLDRRLNRPHRADRERRRRGVVLVVLVVGGAAAIGLGIAVLARRIPHLWIVEVLIVAILLAQRSLFEHVHDVARALHFGGLAAGRDAVARIVGRDPDSLDEYGVARAAIESLAENFSDAVVAPAVWYLLLGLPGMVAYKAVNTLDSMVGYRNDTYRAFGWASARLDDLLNLLPARLSGGLIVLAALFAPKGRPWAALVTMFRDARHHRSPNSGWPEAAMAGALDLALGGPRRYPGVVVDETWLGQGRAKATVAEIDRALVLFAAAAVLNAGGVVLALMAGG
ncbi:MAG: cobalamin biosynthesis protein [Magnetospirillum sp.]|nr:cobalamin biosynthesis protein [Magnetospirillum sp.]